MTEHCESSDGDSIRETVLEGIALRRAGRISAAEVLFQSVLSGNPATPTHCINWVSFQPGKPRSAVRFNC